MYIRDARESDLPAIVNIYNSTIPSGMVTADTKPVSVQDRRAWFREHQSGRLPIWVAQTDDTIAGWLSLSAFSPRPAYNPTAEVSIYVAEEYRGRGIGKKLLVKAIEQSPGLGLTNLLGLIFAQNKPSLILFKKFGFERWGYLPGVAVHEDGIEKDLVIVGLRVAP